VFFPVLSAQDTTLKGTSASASRLPVSLLAAQTPAKRDFQPIGPARRYVISLDGRVTGHGRYPLKVGLPELNQADLSSTVKFDQVRQHAVP
jgi:hypothetical protein